MFKKVIATIMAVLMATALLTGCGNSKDADLSSKGTVTIGYVNWVDVIALTNVATIILEDTMGYTVESTMADLAPIYTSIASGSTDVYLGTWLPLTHAAHMDKYGDDLEVLGNIYEEGVQGLTVPSYVDIDSIEDLKGNEALFNNKIIGVDPGGGIMQATEKAIEEYGLDLELINGSDPTMTAALNKAISANEPIIVTGWKPHWKFIKHDLKILADPKLCYGEEEKAYVIARLGLSEEMPEVAELLANMYFTIDQLQEIIYMMDVSEKDNKDVCREWIFQNVDVVNSWLPEGYAVN
ncbi:MAG: glycine betaine ABC transporter substrate-binding protein [Clostridiales bacterium]|nr:glycine betaine ABC transporter substrate-binding protein [Clostridiales bacterium]